MFTEGFPGSTTVIDSISQISRHPVFAFVPQMSATIISGFILSWRYDQEFAWFIQTVVFVTFNKVCTSQVSNVGQRRAETATLKEYASLAGETVLSLVSLLPTDHHTAPKYF